MKNLKNPLLIVGALAFLVVAGLAWNYTEAIKTKNEIGMEKIAIKASDGDLAFELKQKEKCLELKRDFQKGEAKVEGILTVEESVIYHKEDNTCYLYTKTLWMMLEGNNKMSEDITDLLKGRGVIWYPSAGQWSAEEFYAEKERLGF